MIVCKFASKGLSVDAVGGMRVVIDIIETDSGQQTGTEFDIYAPFTPESIDATVRAQTKVTADGSFSLDIVAADVMLEGGFR